MLEQEKLQVEMKASQRERDEIASELHNDFLPNLAAIKYWLHQINSNDNIKLDQSILLLNDTIEKSKSIIKNISPVSLYGISFQSAIADFILSINKKNKLRINLTDQDEIKCTADQNNLLFRILQEIILNTLKHAEANRLEIEISKSGSFLLIRTADDGVGFNVLNSNKTGFGLLSIKNKVDYLNGAISINSQNKKGTQIIIEIPMM